MSQFVEQENLRAVFALSAQLRNYAVPGAGPGGWAIEAIVPPKTYESNFIHHDFVQFGKTEFMIRSHFAVRCFVTVVLQSLYFISLAVVNP